jgi:hypothetical protein
VSEELKKAIKNATNSGSIRRIDWETVFTNDHLLLWLTFFASKGGGGGDKSFYAQWGMDTRILQELSLVVMRRAHFLGESWNREHLLGDHQLKMEGLIVFYRNAVILAWQYLLRLWHRLQTGMCQNCLPIPFVQGTRKLAGCAATINPHPTDSGIFRSFFVGTRERRSCCLHSSSGHGQ